MNRSRPLLTAVALGLAVALTGCTDDAGPRVTTLPEVSLAPLQGSGPEVMLSDLKGPMVVNLWASWCTPCRTEMPILQEYSVQHPEVKVLGIDHADARRDAAIELVAETGVTYELLQDPDEELNGAAPFPRLRGLPFWAVVDAEGTVVHQQYKQVHSLEELETMVSDALAGASPGTDGQDGG